MWGSKNIINAITLTSVLSNKCFLQLDVVWTKLRSRLFDLNSLRQMKIIAVENKSIPSPVKKLSYSCFFKLPLHLALFCWDCLPMRGKYNFSSARTLRYHAAVICQWHVSQYLSQVGMICLGSPRLLPEVLTLMLPIHSTVASTSKEMIQPEELPLTSICSQLTLSKWHL